MAVRRLTSSRLVRGLGSMIAGGALGQGLVVLSAPLLTRLYGPLDFGVFAVFTAVVLTLSVVFTLRLEAAIVLPESDEDAAAVAWTALSAAVAASVVVALLGPFAAVPVAELFSVPGLAPLWPLIPVAALSVAVFQVFSSWIVRERRYRALGLRNLAQGGGTAASQLGLGVAGVGAVGLLLGQVLGYLIGLGGLASRWGVLRQQRPSATKMWAIVVRYRRFPLVSSWSALLNTAGLQVPLLIISALYGQLVVGLLGLTMRVLAGPLVLIGRNVAQVFVGEAGAATRGSTRSLCRQVKTTTGSLLVLGAVPTVVLLVAGPDLFDFFFGASWADAGRYAQLLSMGFLAQLAVSPVSQTLLILEQQGSQLAWDAGRLVLTSGGPLVAYGLGGTPRTAVVVLSSALVLTYAALYVVCLRAARGADLALAEGTGRMTGSPDPSRRKDVG